MKPLTQIEPGQLPTGVVLEKPGRNLDSLAQTVALKQLPGGTSNTTDGPGYTGYSGSATFTHGPQSVCIDRRTNAMYSGFNTKSVLPGGEPDFEPAVMAMDADGELL